MATAARTSSRVKASWRELALGIVHPHRLFQGLDLDRHHVAPGVGEDDPHPVGGAVPLETDRDGAPIHRALARVDAREHELVFKLAGLTHLRGHWTVLGRLPARSGKINALLWIEGLPGRLIGLGAVLQG